MIDFIFNGCDSHSEILTSLITSSDRIVLCAAYWKSNGVSKIRRSLIKAAKNAKVKIGIYVGLDEKITELSALEELLTLKDCFPNISVIACWMQRKTRGPIFHSKVFYFSKGNEFTAIVGSANVTKNGLDNNSESSIRHTNSVGSEFDQKLQSYFAELDSAPYTFPLDMPLIEEYKAWPRKG